MFSYTPHFLPHTGGWDEQHPFVLGIPIDKVGPAFGINASGPGERTVLEPLVRVDAVALHRLDAEYVSAPSIRPSMCMLFSSGPAPSNEISVGKLLGPAPGHDRLRRPGPGSRGSCTHLYRILTAVLWQPLQPDAGEFRIKMRATSSTARPGRRNRSVPGRRTQQLPDADFILKARARC